MPTIPKFPFQISRGKGKSEGILGNTILGNTMAAASNTLRKSLARVATRKTPSGRKVIEEKNVLLENSHIYFKIMLANYQEVVD
jgi:hypothetical protein